MSPHYEAIRRQALTAAINAWLCVISDAEQCKYSRQPLRLDPARYFVDGPAAPPIQPGPQGLPWE